MDIRLRNTILGIVLAVVLSVVIVFEFKLGFTMLFDAQVQNSTDYIAIAKSVGSASVSIDEIIAYDEVPFEDTDGDVIQLDNYDVKIKVDGTMTDSSMSSYGKYTCSSSDNSESYLLTVEFRSANLSQFRDAIAEYWYGDVNYLLDVCDIDTSSGDLIYYQSSSTSGNVPVVFVGRTGLYYMFIECNDGYMILSAAKPFILTDEKVTVHYGDPSANPMLAHTYSSYETWAAENTIRELLNGDDNTTVNNPYVSSSVIDDGTTYTTEADDAIRRQMVALASYTFGPDGKSNETSYVVDITSSDAQASKWTLTSTEYSYEHAGLKISMLSGKRSSTEFSVSGNINNTIESSRPYVIVVKYLDSNNELLGLSVIDKREEPLAPSGVSTFSTTITPAKNNIDIQQITSVMFEVY
jgi:hypothetical protein